jgi:ABC-2 type transport system ATP-binding protein
MSNPASIIPPGSATPPASIDPPGSMPPPASSPPIPPPAVEIEGLGFTHPRQAAPLFSGLGLKIAAGESFGLFGPNGAGKTTLMNLMTGLFAPQQGSIRIMGAPITRDAKGSGTWNRPRRSVNSLFGFIPQDFSFYEELSSVQNLAFFGAWSGLRKPAIKKRTAELLEIMGLAEVRHQQVHEFSGGMKRRLNLAIGMIHQPEILFLDEPTVGVDVQTRYAIINYLKELNKKGATLIYTSHQLKEAEDLCDRVALIDEGKIIAHDDLDTLLSTHREGGLEGLFLKLTGKD